MVKDQQELNDFLGNYQQHLPNFQGTIMDRLNCRYSSGSLADRQASFLADTAPWMGNPMGIVHGGVTATILDTCMGLLGNALNRGSRLLVTVNLNVSYVQAVRVGMKLMILTEAVHVGKNIISLRGEIFEEGAPDKVLVHGVMEAYTGQ